MRLLSVILLLCLVFQGKAATVACTENAITNAIATASSGDTINIQAGSCTINSTISIANKALFINGAGSNQTIITSGALSTLFDWNNSPGYSAMSQMELVGDAANGTGLIVTSGGGGPYRFHHLSLTNIMGRGIAPGRGDSFGLIDHCRFITAATGSFNPVSPEGNSYASWATANPLGTTNACYVEDCYFEQTFGNGGNGFIDGYNGAQVVIRYSLFNGGAYNGTHGYDSQPTSTRTHETYNCVFTNWALNGPSDAIRGGVFMYFSNKVYLASGSGLNANAVSPQLQYYRGAFSSSYAGYYGFAGLPAVNTFSANFNPGDNTSMGNQGNYYWVASLSGQPADRVLIGANLMDSLTNLSYAINSTPAQSGVKYTAGTQRNWDFLATGVLTNSIILTNVLDGFGLSGYPAAFQPGLIGTTQYTNTGNTVFGCYSWSNLCYDAGSPSPMNFVIRWTDVGDYAQYNVETNLMKLNRDYFNDTIPAANVYQPLTYPHPLTQIGYAAGTKGNKIKGIRLNR